MDIDDQILVLFMSCPRNGTVITSLLTEVKEILDDLDSKPGVAVCRFMLGTASRLKQCLIVVVRDLKLHTVLEDRGTNVSNTRCSQANI